MPKSSDAPTVPTPLLREEYIEQEHFFQILRERTAANVPVQEALGGLISSSGGAISDSNGKNTFLPFTQTYSITAAAPALAASAGVRFTSGNSGFAGLTADNFTFAAVPEPGGIAWLGLAGGVALRRHRRPARGA
jgi:hypothetical protein